MKEKRKNEKSSQRRLKGTKNIKESRPKLKKKEGEKEKERRKSRKR